MLNKKKLLQYLTMAFVFFAFTNVAYVSSSVLQPSDKAKSQRSVHNVSTLHKGDYRYEDFERNTPWNEKVLLLKDWDGVLHTYLVPTNKEGVPMPDRYWGWGWYHCKDFRPETEANGKIKRGGTIKCHDQDSDRYSMQGWQWSYNGEPKHQWLPDMDAPETETIGKKLYLNQ